MQKPLVMGILNVTPDSFSGSHFGLEKAVDHALRMAAEGADLIDVGGESTRPGADPVPEDEEKRRVIPVIEALRARLGLRISIDTRKPEVAKAAIAAGATLVNDVTGGRDPRMADVVAQTGVDCILMHMQGDPQTMQQSPAYPGGVVEEVRAYLIERVRKFEEAGVPKGKVWVDPGIGFGKTLDHNLELLRRLEELKEVGGRLVIGTSRKSFLARLLGDASLSFDQREAGTLASNLWALQKGASVFRVHEVGELRRALATWGAICG